MNENYTCIIDVDNDRIYGKVDDEEWRIMEECGDNLLTTTEDIKNSLIGAWGLVGYGLGRGSTASQPCEYFIVDSDVLSFHQVNENTDTITVHQWEIEEMVEGGHTYFKINLIPEARNGLSIVDHFCENYMFGNHVPRDGSMYIYKKLN